jgi:hypothetical protein
VQITAEKGPLPENTYLRVFYQGGKAVTEPGMLPHEDYDVRRPPAGNVDVCCRTGAAVDGRLPAVPCGLPTATDASVETDAALVTEAGSDGSRGGSGDAALGRSDAATDAGVTSDSGSSGGAPAALLCDLWTNGQADIVLTGASYPRFEKTLSVEFDECGVVRRDVRIIWTQSDGGS